ncbi:hypothetical protein AB0D10_05415 [Kitasatospora sp. NPDC048545]|uniref:hypothetical protein n=1 Tax=Kitasatospora sp. NPDC048545 TaxID=3157208 RepID=UPI003401D3E9
MSNPEYVPVSAAYLRNFFDADGKPLEGRSKCPTCGRTNLFQLDFSNGEVMRFSSPCHAFEVPTPN